MAQGLNRGKGLRGGSEKFIVTFNDVVEVFVDYINDDFSEDELNTISYYYYSLLPADFVARALAEAKKQAGKVSDSRRIKDSEVDVEQAVYQAVIEASPVVQDALVDVVRNNYDVNNFETTDSLANTIWNDIDYLVSQLPEELQEDYEDTYGY